MIKERIEVMKKACASTHKDPNHKELGDKASIAALELLEDFLLTVKNIDENLSHLNMEIQHAIRDR